jgi:hypothetical protein
MFESIYFFKRAKWIGDMIVFEDEVDHLIRIVMLFEKEVVYFEDDFFENVLI